MMRMKGLLRKDWKLAKKSFLQNVAAIFVAWTFGIGLALYYNEPTIATGIGMFLLLTHLLYIGVGLPILIHQETKSMQWLHNPSPAFALLTSKSLVSLLSLFLSLSFTFILVSLSNTLMETPVWMDGEQWWELAFLFGGITLVSVYLGFWGLFIWVMLVSVRTKSGLGKLSQILIGLSIFPLFHVHQWSDETKLYTHISEIGVLPMPTFGSQFENETITFGMTMGEVSLGLIGFYAMICAVLFFLTASWMEKKMEM
ncbi:hypothetical protein ABN702_12070 [Bacillus haimaensis]|uniref:hypothetical protein n=1 Tax=Bacillus haimaensis TaxID=3160967 RepID=UPI003AA7C435